MVKFRFIDHTGDLGIEVYGDSLRDLFQHAGEAFADIVTDAETIRPQESKQICLDADNIEDLLVRWLNEFVFLFDTEDLLFSVFDIVSVDDHHIEATVKGEAYDDTRHPINTTVKGATYHQLEVVRQNDLWKAHVIFDL
jgi:SHS2 domain-containing protein